MRVLKLLTARPSGRVHLWPHCQALSAIAASCLACCPLRTSMYSSTGHFTIQAPIWSTTMHLWRCIYAFASTASTWIRVAYVCTLATRTFTRGYSMIGWPYADSFDPFERHIGMHFAVCSLLSAGRNVLLASNCPHVHATRTLGPTARKLHVHTHCRRATQRHDSWQPLQQVQTHALPPYGSL